MSHAVEKALTVFIINRWVEQILVLLPFLTVLLGVCGFEVWTNKHPSTVSYPSSASVSTKNHLELDADALYLRTLRVVQDGPRHPSLRTFDHDRSTHTTMSRLLSMMQASMDSYHSTFYWDDAEDSQPDSMVQGFKGNPFMYPSVQLEYSVNPWSPAPRLLQTLKTLTLSQNDDFTTFSDLLHLLSAFPALELLNIDIKASINFPNETWHSSDAHQIVRLPHLRQLSLAADHEICSLFLQNVMVPDNVVWSVEMRNCDRTWPLGVWDLVPSSPGMWSETEVCVRSKSITMKPLFQDAETSKAAAILKICWRLQDSSDTDGYRALIPRNLPLGIKDMYLNVEFSGKGDIIATQAWTSFFNSVPNLRNLRVSGTRLEDCMHEGRPMKIVVGCWVEDLNIEGFVAALSGCLDTRSRRSRLARTLKSIHFLVSKNPKDRSLYSIEGLSDYVESQLEVDPLSRGDELLSPRLLSLKSYIYFESASTRWSFESLLKDPLRLWGAIEERIDAWREAQARAREARLRELEDAEAERNGQGETQTPEAPAAPPTAPRRVQEPLTPPASPPPRARRPYNPNHDGQVAGPSTVRLASPVRTGDVPMLSPVLWTRARERIASQNQQHAPTVTRNGDLVARTNPPIPCDQITTRTLTPNSFVAETPQTSPMSFTWRHRFSFLSGHHLAFIFFSITCIPLILILLTLQFNYRPSSHWSLSEGAAYPNYRLLRGLSRPNVGPHFVFNDGDYHFLMYKHLKHLT